MNDNVFASLFAALKALNDNLITLAENQAENHRILEAIETILSTTPSGAMPAAPDEGKKAGAKIQAK